MKKFHILLIVLFGFLLMPSAVSACGNHSEKSSCCNKETTSKTDKDDCCKNDSHSKNKNHDGCGGKCGHSKCGCSFTTTAFSSTFEVNIKNNVFDFSYQKQKFYNSETNLSSGFHFLWLIPKIS